MPSYDVIRGPKGCCPSCVGLFFSSQPQPGVSPSAGGPVGVPGCRASRGGSSAAQHRPLRWGRNHGVVGAGRDLWGAPAPTPLPKQGHLQQAAQDRVQAGLEYLQRRRLHNLPVQPVPGLRHPQREEVLPHVQTELPMLHFVPIAPCPVAGHH